MKILIDNGHGQSTPGKRSPDGRFLEFQFNRTIAKQIVDDLRDRGYDAELLVPEDDDVPLKDRCKRVNDIVAREGKQNVSSQSTPTPSETAKNGHLLPDGASIPAKDKQRQMIWQSSWPRLQSRTCLR